jgi:YD repeat-containing protein
MFAPDQVHPLRTIPVYIAPELTKPIAARGMQPAAPARRPGSWATISAAFGNCASAAVRLAVACSLLACTCRPQTIGSIVTGDTATPIPGAGHDYVHLLSETVDPGTGQLNVRIALPMPKSRGIDFPFAIVYNSGSARHLDASGSGGNTPVWVAASFGGSTGGEYGQGGWGYIWLPKLSSSSWETTQGSTNTLVYCDFFANYMFTDATGTGHNLGLGWVTAHGAGVNNQYQVGSPCGSITQSSGDSQYSAYLTPGGANASPNSVVVQDVKDGTVYVFNAAAGTQGIPPMFIEDRNGNKVTGISSPVNGYPMQYTDTAGRAVLSVTGTGAAGTGDTVKIGAVSSESLSFTVKWASVPVSYQVPSRFVSAPTGVTCGSTSSMSQVSGTQTVVSEIDLPNGQKYSFTYNSMGLLSQITYPDGGWVKYQWTTSVQNTYSESAFFNGTTPNGFGFNVTPSACLYQYTPPEILERQVSFDGTNVILEQDFAKEVNWPAPVQYWDSRQSIVTTKDYTLGNVHSFTKTYVYDPYPMYTQPYQTTLIATEMPLENSIKTTDWDSGNLLDTETKGWVDPFELACDFHSAPAKGRANLVSGHFFQYYYRAIRMPGNGSGAEGQSLTRK